MNETTPAETPKKRGRPPKNAEAMQLICISVTPHQIKLLGRDRSQKVRECLALAGYPEKPDNHL